jgi:hypothetical protein
MHFVSHTILPVQCPCKDSGLVNSRTNIHKNRHIQHLYSVLWCHLIKTKQKEREREREREKQRDKTIILISSVHFACSS